jgi:hypothetical protein
MTSALFNKVLSMIITVIVIALVLILISGGFKPLFAFLRGIDSDTTSQYFEVKYIGISETSKLANGCQLTNSNTYICSPTLVSGAQLELYVGITNKAGSGVSVYATPQVSEDCDANGNKCKNSYTMTRTKECVVPAKKENFDCYTGIRPIFGKTKVYKISAAASMSIFDSQDLTGPSSKEETSSNKDQFIIVKVN